MLFTRLKKVDDEPSHQWLSGLTPRLSRVISDQWTSEVSCFVTKTYRNVRAGYWGGRSNKMVLRVESLRGTLPNVICRSWNWKGRRWVPRPKTERTKNLDCPVRQWSVTLKFTYTPMKGPEEGCLVRSLFWFGYRRGIFSNLMGRSGNLKDQRWSPWPEIEQTRFLTPGS